MDILDELNLPSGFPKDIAIEDAFEIPGEGLVKNNIANERSSEDSYVFEQKPSPEIPIELKQITVRQEQHPVVKVEEEKPVAQVTEEPVNQIRDTLFAKVKPTIDYRKIYKDFAYFFSLYPLVSLNNFKAAEKLFMTYFSNRREAPFRIAEFKKAAKDFSDAKSKFGTLDFDFKLKAHSIQITMQRSRLKGVKQYISIPFLETDEFISFTQWNWKYKKEELLRSRDPYKKKKVTVDSLAFDSKVWQAFNNAGMRRKHFMKSLDCFERNQDHVIDFIKLVNKKTILSLIEPDLISNVSIKTDNHNTLFLNFRTNLSQKVGVRLTNFASSIVVRS